MPLIDHLLSRSPVIKASVLTASLMLTYVSTVRFAWADSARAECGFAATADEVPEETSACTFSQRQGFVNIDIDGGPGFDLRPTGKGPGDYVDANGRTVYRRSGLADQGQLFQLPERYLYVYWLREQWDCSGGQLASPAGCQLAYGDIVFSLRASDEGSLNRLTIEAAGLQRVDLMSAHEIDGVAYRAEVADLDANGWPEVYAYISSAGSGSYGSLVAYAVNNGKSATPIYLRPLTEDPAASLGYMGHDEFAVVENRLVRRFPVYNDGDTNSKPTGGMRQVQYRLVPGEAGWLLEVDRIVEYMSGG